MCNILSDLNNISTAINYVISIIAIISSSAISKNVTSYFDEIIQYITNKEKCIYQFSNKHKHLTNKDLFLIYKNKLDSIIYKLCFTPWLVFIVMSFCNFDISLFLMYSMGVGPLIGIMYAFADSFIMYPKKIILAYSQPFKTLIAFSVISILFLLLQNDGINSSLKVDLILLNFAFLASIFIVGIILFSVNVLVFYSPLFCLIIFRYIFIFFKNPITKFISVVYLAASVICIIIN